MNDVKLLTEKYEEVQENKVLSQILTEDMTGLKDLVGKYKAAKEANNQPEIQRLGDEIINVLAIEFAPEAKEAVQAFENDKLMTTRGNYGKYMQFLSMPNMRGMYKVAMVKALRTAGAGQGLSDALRVMQGE